MARTSRPTRPLAGQAVLITGAARGTGAELARKTAARGARIALVGLEPELLAAVATELGPEHLWVEADVTDADAMAAAVQRAVDVFGGLDIVVANDGIAPMNTVPTASARALARTIEVNLTGAMLTVHAALAEISKSRGHVLLISSAAAFSGLSAYWAAKAGLERFGDVLRLEVAHRGVTVASAHPVWIDTDMVRDTKAALPFVHGHPGPAPRLPGPLGSYTSVSDCADALLRNLENRGRRVFVPRSVGFVSAWRQTIIGALGEKLVLARARTAVPQLERKIAALDGEEFGANSVERGRGAG